MSSVSTAVFLSYASQDADAAGKICDALRVAGVEVWFDQSELRGGDAWDQKIRRQIKECALFVPVISANTQARTEGYFRLEWRLADQRTHLMAKGRPFLLPVVIDETRDAEAHVPDSFFEVQWTRLRLAGSSGRALLDPNLAALCERVATLLEGKSKLPTRARTSVAEATGMPVVSHKHSVRWLVPASIGIAVLAALALWRTGLFNSKPQTPNLEPSTALAPPSSEARQLTLKARALIDDDWMAVRENFRLAEELGAKAVKLAPDDGEAWATLARISNGFIERGYDTSTERRAAAKTQIERAERLAPDAVETVLAIAHRLRGTREWAELERRLRAAQPRAPQDPRVLLLLAQVLNELGRDDEASQIRIHHPVFGAGDPRGLVAEARTLRQKLRFLESEALAERAQALRPTLDGYYVKLYTRLMLLNTEAEVKAARDFVATLPPQLLLEDAFASTVGMFWIRMGEGEKALEVLQRVPRDFFEENLQIHPKGILTGWAHRIAGRPAAAAAEWSQALAVVEKRRAAEPNTPGFIRHKALLLALTGQREEAEKQWRLFSELSRRPAGQESYFDAEFHLALDRPEQAIRALLGTSGSERSLRTAERARRLRHDPWYAPIRDDPRVRQIIAEESAWLTELLRAEKERLSAGRSEAAAPAKSVAVLAFANDSGDKANEYFSDGISEELLNLLAKISGLKVTARTSAFHFKGKDTPIPEIAKQLGVAYIVEGTVRKAGNEVRIAARLINGADGVQVWADSFREELKDVFALQDKVAGLVAKNLALKLGTGLPGAVSVSTTNLEAYDMYLRARALQTGGETMQTRRETVRLYQQTVELDPGYALAWARLSQSGLRASAALFPRSEARRAAETALRLAPELPEAHLAIALVRLRLDKDYEATSRALDEAERRRPNDAEVVAVRAQLESARGRWDAALAALVIRSVELDPQNVALLSTGARILREMGRFAEADQLCVRWIAVAPTLTNPISVRCDNLLAWTGDRQGTLAVLEGLADDRFGLAFALELRAELRAGRGDLASAIADYGRVREFFTTGRLNDASYRMARLESQRGERERASELYAEALAETRQRTSENPESGSAAELRALLHAARGEKAEALAAIDDAMRIAELNRDASWMALTRRITAEALALLGEQDAAIAELRAVHERGYGFGYTLRTFLRWEPLRDDPKFQQLMKEAEARADAQPSPLRGKGRGQAPSEGRSPNQPVGNPQ